MNQEGWIRMKRRGKKEKGGEGRKKCERENGVRSKVGYRDTRIGGRFLLRKSCNGQA